MQITHLILHYIPARKTWLNITLQLSGTIWIFGIVCGTVLWVLCSRNKSINTLHNITNTLLWWIPVLVLIYRAYFPLQQLMHIQIDSFVLVAGCLSIVNSIAVADLVKSAINNLPKEYVLLWTLCGLDKKTIIRHVQLPLILRHILWPLIMLQVTMMHATIFASLINVDEIFRQIQRVNAIEYKPIELYSILACIFLCISIPLQGFAKYFNTHFWQYDPATVAHQTNQ